MSVSLRRQNGFTLAELTISMAIASIAIVVLMQAVIRLYHIYEANIAIRSTQQVARSITKEIDADARDASVATAAHTATGDRVCLFSNPATDASYDGFIYYTQTSRAAVNGVQPIDLYRHAFTNQALAGGDTAPTTNTCKTFDVTGGTNARLNGDDTSVLGFSGSISTASPTLLNLSIAAGASYALDFVDMSTTPPTCKSATGSQYCSVTSLATSVQTRGGNR